jgi:hypothetical protein
MTPNKSIFEKQVLDRIPLFYRHMACFEARLIENMEKGSGRDANSVKHRSGQYKAEGSHKSVSGLLFTSIFGKK